MLDQFRLLSRTMYGNTGNFAFFFSLKQLISCPTRISCSSPTIIDHILASQPENVSQKRSLALKFRIVNLYFVLGKLLKLRQDQIKKSIPAH